MGIDLGHLVSGLSVVVVNGPGHRPNDRLFSQHIQTIDLLPQNLLRQNLLIQCCTYG